MNDPLASIYEDASTNGPDLTSPEPTPQQEDANHIVTFHGFASPTPFLLEHPSGYLNRLADAARTLLIADPNSPNTDPATRAVHSPALSLPIFLPEPGDAMHPETEHYPLIHLPEGRPYDNPELPFDAYALAMVIAYEMDDINIMGEPGGGDLTAWDNTPRYAVPDKYWSRALHLAEEIYRPLKALNLARLVLSAREDPNERRLLMKLCCDWQVEESPAELVDAGRRARPLVEQHWQEIASQAPCDLLDIGGGRTAEQGER